MNPPPVAVTVISALYFISALAGIFFIEDFGYFESSIYVGFCLVMSLGLWFLKKWARIIELIICWLQILSALILGSIVLFLHSESIVSKKMPLFLLMLVTIVVISGLIIKYLSTASSKELFH
jgi:hypothetical protein